MFGSSSSSDKSSVIYPNVNETITHTLGDVVASVNEKIYARFHQLLIKTPVVFIHEQIPADVLDWYKTYVFGQSENTVQPLTKEPVLDLPKESPIKPIVINPDENGDISAIKDDESIVMDFEEAKEALQDSVNFETNQTISKSSEEPSVQSISIDKIEEDKNGEKDDPKGEDKSENTNIGESTKLHSNVSETKEEENNQMDVEVIKQSLEELLKPELDQSVNQPSKESSKPKVETNLQLSEESSNESINLESSDDVNTELMQNLLSTVLETMIEDSKAMEIEDLKQLSDESLSQLESNQSVLNQSEHEEQSKLEIITQSSIQLSEESSNGSISIDDEEDDKQDNKNDDKMQNIKNNSNVLATIEDENNVLDFEDI